MTFEEIAILLISRHILQNNQCDEITIKNFIGPPNLIRGEENHLEHYISPSLAQIRKFCYEFCVFPLGSRYVKENTTPIPCILLYGPNGCGKTLLSRAIGYEANTRWFNISPAIINTFEEEEIDLLIHLTFQLAIKVQPSIIYIDNIEEIFQNKSKEHPQNPSYLKVRKSLETHRDDLLENHKNARVLILGNSEFPWKSDDLHLFFQDSTTHDELCLASFLPFPDYHARVKLWMHFFEIKGIDVIFLAQDNFEFGLLSKLSRDFTAGQIEECVDLTLTNYRINHYRLGVSKLRIESFLYNFSQLTTKLSKEDRDHYLEYASETCGRDAFLQWKSKHAQTEA